MDLTRPQPAGGLTVLDLSARLNFRTASSVSFNLGRYGSRILKDGPLPEPKVLENVFRVVGWADVHYPCEGIFKAYVRIGLPAEYRGKVAGKVATYAVRRIVDWLDIPPHETCDAGL